MKKTSLAYSTKLTLRNENGSLGILIPCTILLLIVGAGSFSADIAHNISVRNQMQNATDAGALAGASALVNPNTAPMAATYATTVTAANDADGVAVSSSVPQSTIGVVINTNVPGEIGTCQVTATQPIHNWLGAIFGRPSDLISTTSTAAASQTVSGIAANIMFPVAVSIDAVPTDKNGVVQKPLENLGVGDTINININSQQYKNGAFTSLTVKNTNADWLNQAIDQSLALVAPQPNFVPSVAIGQDIYLDNGVSGQKTLAGSSELQALQAKGDIVLPVIQGNPPFNQTSEVIGWVAIKVTSVVVNQAGGQVEIIQGTIAHAPVRGQAGALLGNSSSAVNNVLNSLSPSSVRLISSQLF